MDNIFVFAGFIAAVFFIAKFIEMRFVEQESKPLKLLVRDTVLVYISAVLGSYVVEQISLLYLHPSMPSLLPPFSMITPIFKKPLSDHPYRITLIGSPTCPYFNKRLHYFTLFKHIFIIFVREFCPFVAWLV